MSWEDKREQEADPLRGIHRGEYGSALFERFCASIARFGSAAEILDIGPSTPSNVMYWVERGHRVAALDYVDHRDRGERDLLQRFASARFAGVLGWTVLSHLARPEAMELMGDHQNMQGAP